MTTVPQQQPKPQQDVSATSVRTAGVTVNDPFAPTANIHLPARGWEVRKELLEVKDQELVWELVEVKASQD